MNSFTVFLCIVACSVSSAFAGCKLRCWHCDWEESLFSCYQNGKVKACDIDAGETKCVVRMNKGHDGKEMWSSRCNTPDKCDKPNTQFCVEPRCKPKRCRYAGCGADLAPGRKGAVCTCNRECGNNHMFVLKHGYHSAKCCNGFSNACAY